MTSTTVTYQLHVLWKKDYWYDATILPGTAKSHYSTALEAKDIGEILYKHRPEVYAYKIYKVTTTTIKEEVNE